MLSRADVTAAQLHHALAEQSRGTGMRIGECMQRLGYVGQQQVTASLAAQWRCPVQHTMPRQLLHYGLPHGLLLGFQMLPVHFVSATRTLHIAFASEIAYRALVAAEHVLDCRTEACLVTPAAFHEGIERLGKPQRLRKSTSPARAVPAKLRESRPVMLRGSRQRTSSLSRVESWPGSELTTAVILRICYFSGRTETPHLAPGN